MESFQSPYGSPLNRSQSLMSGLEKTPPTCTKPTHSRSSSTASSRHSRNIKDWEVMDDLQMDMTSADILQDLTAPGICEGYLLKRRKWPLKGWHKRYFVLETGILRYSKTQQDIYRGKLHGSLDVSLAVMSINKKSHRIDLDAGNLLYHIKAKSHELFYIWVTKLSAHRMFKKNEAANQQNGFLQTVSQDTSGTGQSQMNDMQDVSFHQQFYSTSGSYTGEVATPTPSEFHPGVNRKVSAWLQQTHDPDSCAQELNRCQLDLSELNRLVQRLNVLEGGQQAFSNGELQRIISMQNLSLEKPKKSRSCKIWGHSRTLSRVDALGMVRQLSSSHLNSSSQLGASAPTISDYAPSIPDYVYSQLSPQTNTPLEGRRIQQEFITVSQRVHVSLASVHEALAQERVRLQDTYHQSTALAETASGDLSRRTPSVTDSAAEYFDANDDVLNGSSSESGESGLSDGTTTNSEPEEGHASATREYRASISKAPSSVVPKNTGRRSALPAHCPDNAHVGLMQILYNNIGKDLSRVSMPAALNEPVNLIQRLCEELEYSDLLDTANNTQDLYQRMVYIGAFAVSGYATAHYRHRYKPFNPLLGETYECLRQDKGFRFVSEQVCHHPPISACHADSDNFSLWQDQRWKNKFWGKSLEIMPTGMVNVTLPRFGDHYEWNKVVTCVHNVLSQQRYLEHYGEVVIRNLNSDACTCKLTFVKSRYWGSDTNKNEVQGTVLDQTGSTIHRFGGLWHEGIFCDTFPTPQCIWKPNPQPKDYYLYYGFSNFALELNELTPDLKPLLPPTDSRLRPDQRMLEEGRVDDCDKFKEDVEERQRERRKQLAKKGEEHVPRFFKKAVDSCGRDVWLTNGTYWKIRENPGFANTKNLELW
ncbi:hypothetical protein DPEC_G00327910 [Dallia pectoralis]|uniref:Uncharacterized protein n=1 Tax=Dallia pectoralis TaxID=75939 RepID=A0ACC2F863_DALPE|nr:hypothetical protein DPEC_G00327910 [Dallia pectoralis]